MATTTTADKNVTLKVVTDGTGVNTITFEEEGSQIMNASFPAGSEVNIYKKAPAEFNLPIESNDALNIVKVTVAL